MATLNHCQFIGNVGKCDTRATQSGEFITNLSVACNEKWKDKSGQLQERTEWVRVSFFGKLAQVAGEYAQKGKLVYFSGRMQTRKFTDKDGQERYTTEIVGDRLQLLGGRDDRDEDRGSQSHSQRPASGGGSAPRPEPEDYDDGIPFTRCDVDLCIFPRQRRYW